MNAALLAVVPKIAGVVALIRILVVAVPHDSAFAWKLVLVLSLATMTLGNVSALWQVHIRRIMADSSIAHAGYLLIGLAAAMGSQTGHATGTSAIAAMVFYVLAYAAATLGFFAALAYLSDDDERHATLASLAGIGRAHPAIGGMMAICLFSLSGIPPLVGFWGKFALFRSALDAAFPSAGTTNPWFLVLAVLGVANATIAAGYYLRIIGALYFQTSENEQVDTPVEGNVGAGLAAIASVLIVIGVGLFTGRAMNGAQAAAAGAWSGAGPAVPAARSAPDEAAKLLAHTRHHDIQR
jgi:NADH-quinone oxidoreductase subunit N